VSALTRESARLLAAVAFLTRVPVPDPGWKAGRMRAAMRYYGVVGAGIGAVAGGVWLGAGLVLPAGVAAGLALGAGLWLTGALHEDGLADCADGLGGGSDRDTVLAIMRDSRTGVYGAVALILAIGLRWQALAALAPASGALALAAAGGIGRALMVPATAAMPYARSAGLGAALSDGAGWRETGLALATALALAGLAGLPGLAALGVAAFAAAALAWRLKRRLGGYTGDGLGAIAAVAETAVLVTLAGLAR